MDCRKDRKFRRTFESDVTNIPILLPRTMIIDLIYFFKMFVYGYLHF